MTDKQNPADQREAMQLALDALEEHTTSVDSGRCTCCSQRLECAATCEFTKARAALRQALSAPAESVAAVPDGWKLVPIVPTDEMTKAVRWDEDAFGGRSAWPSDIYRDMLAAAPPAPAREPLTIAQINEAWDLAVETSDPTSAQLRFKFTRAIEIAHNIKAAE